MEKAGSNSPNRLIGFAINTKDFFRVSAQLHALNLIAGVVTIYFASFLVEEIKNQGYLSPELGLLSAMFSVIVPVFIVQNIFTSFVNLHNFKRVKQKLMDDGWDSELIHKMSRTFCKRRAVTLAAIDAGYREEIENYNKN